MQRLWAEATVASYPGIADQISERVHVSETFDEKFYKV